MLTFFSSIVAAIKTARISKTFFFCVNFKALLFSSHLIYSRHHSASAHIQPYEVYDQFSWFIWWLTHTQSHTRNALDSSIKTNFRMELVFSTWIRPSTYASYDIRIWVYVCANCFRYHLIFFFCAQFFCCIVAVSSSSFCLVVVFVFVLSKHSRRPGCIIVIVIFYYMYLILWCTINHAEYYKLTTQHASHLNRYVNVNCFVISFFLHILTSVNFIYILFISKQQLILHTSHSNAARILMSGSVQIFRWRWCW